MGISISEILHALVGADRAKLNDASWVSEAHQAIDGADSGGGQAEHAAGPAGAPAEQPAVEAPAGQPAPAAAEQGESYPYAPKAEGSGL
jgi:hypothetical protein